jgi:aminocarboxymuconate-semialdehyde decarboxylase
MDRNVTNRPDSMQNITRKPSDYLRAFYYDTCVYDPEVLAALIRRVGADRLVMGSDYPVGDNDPVASVKATPGISDSEVAQITGGNAARLLGLDAR